MMWCLLFLFIIGSNLVAMPEIMPVSEIKEGMRGIGKTVFAKTEIEKFDVEIIGVLKNVRGPKGDIILARLSSPVLEKSGVIAGMSGSPVYISNRLIGAVAFSWSFSKEPIAGITPIEDMLAVLNIKSEEDERLRGSLIESKKKIFARYNDKSIVLEQIKTPLMISGLDEFLIRQISGEFEKYNLLPVQAGITGTEKLNKTTLSPGDGVGVMLISGDLSFTAIGTVTWTNKNEVLIFGHPMFFKGKADLPLTTAYVHTVLSSLMRSFKLASPCTIIGKTIQDRLPAVSGKLYEYADLIPLSVKVETPSGEIKNYKYNVANDQILTPSLLAISAINSAVINVPWLQKGSANFRFEILFDDNTKVVFENLFADITSDINFFQAMRSFLAGTSMMLVNKFKPVNIKNVFVDIKLSDEIKIAEIEAITIDKKIYNPGDIIDVKVEFKPYLGKPFIKNFKFQLPEELAAGDYSICVASGTTEQAHDYNLSPSKYKPKNFEQLLNIINNIQKNNEIVLWVQTKEKGLILNGEEFSNLPVSFYSILKESRQTGSEDIVLKIKQKFEIDTVILGMKELSFTIKKK